MTQEKTRFLARLLVKDSQFKHFAREMGMSDTDLYAICRDCCKDGTKEESYQVIKTLQQHQRCIDITEIVIALRKLDLQEVIRKFKSKI